MFYRKIAYSIEDMRSEFGVFHSVWIVSAAAHANVRSDFDIEHSILRVRDFMKYFNKAS